FVPVEVDADKNPRLVEAVGVEGLPTTVIVSPELRVLKKITGYHPPHELNKQLETICPASYEVPAEPAGRVAQAAELKAEENPFADPEPARAQGAAPAVTQTASTA